MKDIYIHIGTHKTGTTFIQNTLLENTKASQSDGWKYLKSPSCTKNFMTSKKYDPILVNKFKKQINSAVNKEKLISKFILSNEALSGDPLDGYLNSEVVSLMLKEATKDYNVKIIIYLRNQCDFLESMYTQKIHEGGTLDFNIFLSYFNKPDSLNYDKLLRYFEVCFGLNNLYIRSYSNVLKSGLLDDFSKIIDSKLLPYTTSAPIKNNISYSRNALEIAKTCNLQINKKQRKQLRKSLQKTMFKKKSEPFSFFSNTERITFIEKFKHSNNNLIKRYFENDLECLNSQNLKHPTTNSSEISCEQASTLLTELFKQHNEKMLSNTIIKKYKAVFASIKLLCIYYLKGSRKANH